MRLRTRLAAGTIAALITPIINLAATQLLAEELQTTGPYPLQVIELNQPIIVLEERLATTKYYLLPVKATQHVTIKLEAGNASAVLFSPTETAMGTLDPDKRQIQFTATENGLHQLAVTIQGHTQISNIKLTITTSPTSDRFAKLQLGRVRFAHGELNKTLTLPPYTDAELIIFPGKQRTSISMSAAGTKIAFVTQSNQPLREGYQQVTSNLPNPGQKYKIVITNNQPNEVKTTLKVTLKP